MVLASTLNLDQGRLTLAGGQYDTERGLRVGLRSENFPRIKIQPDGQILTGSGAVEPATVLLSATGALTLSSYLVSTNDLTARNGNAAQVDVGAEGPAGEAGIKFGSAGNEKFYRQNVNVLESNVHLRAIFDLMARRGSSTEMAIGAVGPGSTAGLTFGSAGDTNLYRSAADTLKTDDAFQTAVSVTTGTHVDVGTTLFLTTNTNSAYIEAVKLSADPAAPGASKGRIYMRDNGSGKVQFVARFPSGAVQVIATEP